jgi:acylphosphatase
MKRVRVVISGRVQGVWFRAWTMQEAAARGLDGWVRNRRDGTVEAVFSGAAETVDRMIALCREGPPSARVDSVEIFADADPVEPGFRQLPSA